MSACVRGMCITQRKIVSNYCFKQCCNKYCLQTIVFLMPFIILRNNKHFFSFKNSKKKLWIFAIVKDGNISPGRKYLYEKIYIHNNVWKFCGDHILIKFFFGCITDIQTNFKKMRQEPPSLKAFTQRNAFLPFFYKHCWCSWPICVKSRRWSSPKGIWCRRLIIVLLLHCISLQLKSKKQTNDLFFPFYCCCTTYNKTNTVIITCFLLLVYFLRILFSYSPFGFCCLFFVF